MPGFSGCSVLGWGDGEGDGFGFASSLGRKARNSASSFFASAVDANSIANTNCGSVFFEGQLTAQSFEPANSSEWALIQFNTVESCSGGSANWTTGSRNSLNACERTSVP